MTRDQVLMAAWVAKAAADRKEVETNFQAEAVHIFKSLELGESFTSDVTNSGYLSITPTFCGEDFYDPSGAIPNAFYEGRDTSV